MTRRRRSSDQITWYVHAASVHVQQSKYSRPTVVKSLRSERRTLIALYKAWIPRDQFSRSILLADTPDMLDITCYEDVADFQITRVRQARLVADMSATRQTILTCLYSLKVASILVASSYPTRPIVSWDVSDIAYSWHLLRGCYEETAPVEFSLKQ